MDPKNHIQYSVKNIHEEYVKHAKGRIVITWYEYFYKAIIIKTMSHLYRVRETINEAKSSQETEPNIYRTLYGQSKIFEGKMVGQFFSYLKIMKLFPSKQKQK